MTENTNKKTNKKSNDYKPTKKATVSQPKVDSVTEEVPSMAELASLIKDLQKKLEEKDKQIQEFQEQFASKNNAEQTSYTKPKVKKERLQAEKIDGDEEITVSSLCVGDTVICTQGYGDGKCYNFHNIGYQIDIPYSDLKEIIHNNRTFIESGRFYIHDDRVVRKHKLEKHYENMLDFDGFERLDKLTPKEFKEILMRLPKEDSTTLTKGNETNQIDLVLDYIMDKFKNGAAFPIESLPYLEQAYKAVKGVDIDIIGSVNTYNEIFNKRG